jgi:hypothetical protein
MVLKKLDRPVPADDDHGSPRSYDSEGAIVFRHLRSKNLLQSFRKMGSERDEKAVSLCHFHESSSARGDAIAQEKFILAI